MSIDWITVLAQLANFLVLVWLLKRFLYRPILDGIDAREAEITKSMAAAGEAQQKAQAAQVDFQQQKKQLQSDQDAMIQKALRDTEDQRDGLLAEARARLEQEQQDWRKHLERERERFTARLQRAGQETLLELTRKALRDLADETLEQAIVRHVGKRLEPLVNELKKAAAGSTQATATTREPLPETAQSQLKTDLEKRLPAMALSFETDTDQAPGLILRIGGAQVAWTVDSYTDEFRALLNERLATGASGRAKAEAE
ncbi:ATP synthase F0 subcomplex B subunit [Marinobacter sp. LV10R520-4]|uniref:F0F1 ATP synthase subunit delta n=1 Tax=Marinobacter sp. LV10R520-4 TaxID=1761796 RepID=UPI000BF53E45|nr:F0F1 ATP synthase subunit delta [Marinobacter sp. LV10R520-4]PFG52236.1 ATP synthase F0 subcomplex B subunit [Marinobacter sp. LV10R520-4]